MTFSGPVMLGISLLFFLVHTCQRFEPEGFLYVTTSSVSGVTANSAVTGGKVTDSGGKEVTARGVCWGTSSKPTIGSGSVKLTTDGTGTGSFSSIITSLNPNTTYYARAYATNGGGTTYGEEEKFTTSPPTVIATVTDIDGNQYQTVQIGNQVWMAENLKTTRYADGEAISLVQGATEWTALTVTDKAYCWYDNSIENRDIYGGLYTWAAAMRGASASEVVPVEIQGVCPSGWHLPGDAEWKELEMTLGISQTVADGEGIRGTDEGGKLKEAGTDHWASPNAGATNESGFTALPGGYRGSNGSFSNVGYSADFRTATVEDGEKAWGRYLDYNNAQIRRYNDDKDFGCSVRCVKGAAATTPPVVTSTAISVITEDSAFGGGTVTGDGGLEVTARGVCWSTSSSPTILDDTTLNGTGLGIFTSAISGLSCETTYYVRAYATNSDGTAYGTQVSFESGHCPVELPAVTTISFSNITETSAQSGGNVTDNGGAAVTARGICWSTSHTPTISDSHTTDGSGMGSYSSSITGLSSGTTYYIRTYASNSVGTNYGDELFIRTKTGSGATITDIDGNVYQTRQIGTQEWMTENLNVTHYPDGRAMLLLEDSIAWDGLRSGDEAYCWYDNNSLFGKPYGAIYTWNAAVNGTTGSDAIPSGVQGVCPDGMHLPSDAEWKELEMYLGMSQSDADKEVGRGTDEGGKLKESGTDHWNSPNAGATNESGFTALPGGSRSHNGSFNDFGNKATFWTATELSGIPWSRSMYYDLSTVYRTKFVSYMGFSVRCVGD